MQLSFLKLRRGRKAKGPRSSSPTSPFKSSHASAHTKTATAGGLNKVTSNTSTSTHSSASTTPQRKQQKRSSGTNADVVPILTPKTATTKDKDTNMMISPCPTVQSTTTNISTPATATPTSTPASTKEGLNSSSKSGSRSFSPPWSLSRKSSSGDDANHGGGFGSGLLKRRRGNVSNYQDTPIDAAWKVDRIPTEQDWWKPSHRPSITSSVPFTPAISSCWKQQSDSDNSDSPKATSTMNATTEDNNTSTSTNKSINYKEQTFHNIGYQNWEASRAQWRQRTVDTTKIKKPPSVRTDTVIRGLSQLQRTYELPGRMTLKDVIGILNRIWYAERD